MLFRSAAGVWAVHSPGPVHRTAVRSAAALPPPSSPPDGAAGQPVLSPGRNRRIPLPPAGGGRAATGFRGAGGTGRDGVVFRRILGAAASCLDLLGRYTGVFGLAFVPACAVDKKFLQKNCPSRKKALLFYEEMLYNKKKRMEASIPGRRQQKCPKKSGRQKENAAFSAPVL